MKAGDVLFFHGSLVHGSRPNSTTDRFRRSLIFHYVPRASVEVSRFYLPLLAPDGTEVTIAESDRDAFTAWWQAGSAAAGELGIGLARTLLLTGLAVPG